MDNVTLPMPDTFPDLLLTLTALSGEFPSALVRRLPGSEYYNRNAVTRMKKAGLLHLAGDQGRWRPSQKIHRFQGHRHFVHIRQHIPHLQHRVVGNEVGFKI